VQSYFSPTDLVAFEVWDLLANAETVHFAMFFFTDDMLAERLAERLAVGAGVYGVMDGLGAAGPYSVDDMLCDAGALIRTERWAGKLHHKFAVLDLWGADPIVITGSYNWTSAGAYSNDENTLIIHDRALAETYYGEWERLWLAAGIENQCNVSVLFLPLVIMQ
jgi:phosphatidylserine/phosphatidylglycerophosphate/cardiolipin synthase-like enzyme